jgi:hypothetical protein
VKKLIPPILKPRSKIFSKRLKVIESLLASNNRPEWMIMTGIAGIAAGIASVSAVGWWSFCHL